MATTAVDSAAVFLYSLFASDQKWTRAHAEKIRKTLGPFPASAANRACELVKKIIKLSPEKIDEDSPVEDKILPDGELKKEFGHNIVFIGPRNLREDGIGFSSEENGGKEDAHDSLSEDEAAGNDDTFSQALLAGMAQKGKTNGSRSEEGVKPKTGPTRGAAMATGDPAPYSSEWLSRKLQQVCVGDGGVTWWDLYMAVFEQLSSSLDSSAIQGDVSVCVCVCVCVCVWGGGGLRFFLPQYIHILLRTTLCNPAPNVHITVHTYTFA